jgi:CPA2 family monovalent cation:H+ antiporter-2
MHAHDLTALALLLTAAVTCGLLITRLRVPAAAGFILVGIGLGPSGAGLIKPDDSIATLAELGVLMLLFIIGMEMRLAAFRKALPLALGITIATIFIITSSVTLFAWLVGGEVLGGAVIGMMLAISSSAVAFKMIEDAQEKETMAGRTALAILVAQDLAVVPLLLITNDLGSEFSPAMVWGIGWRVILAVALLAGFIHLLTKIKSFHVPGSQYLMKDADIGTVGVLGICFACAAASGLLGLSPALGAFLGGLIVGHSTLRRGALTMAQPVQSILLFVFFLSVGLLIDLTYLADHAFVIGAALVVVTGGKTFLNWLLMMASGEKMLVALKASLFLSPVGEFSFVIAATALSVRALSPEGYKLAMAVIAMSLLVSPLFFVFARIFHRMALGRFRVMGEQLAEWRLWTPRPAAAATAPGE